ncbi:MAG TPA: hypothetical protein VGI91_05645 [Steroidobacteraceae bacterium]|jgi:hypothetical protein
MWRYLTDPLKGKTPLWQVVWIYGVGVSVVYALLEPLFPVAKSGFGAYFVLGLLIGILQSVMVWQCAYNSKYPRYGHVLRVFVVIGLLLVPLMLYVLWSHPELAELAG